MPTEHTFRDERKPVVVFYDIQLDDAGLTPYEFRTYQRIARRCAGQAEGRCTESLDSMADACGMSRPKLVRSIKVLIERKMVTRYPSPGKESTYALRDKSHWWSKEVWIEWKAAQPGKPQSHLSDEENEADLVNHRATPGKPQSHHPALTEPPPGSDVTTNNINKSSKKKNTSSPAFAGDGSGDVAPFESDVEGGNFGHSGSLTDQPTQAPAPARKKRTGKGTPQTAPESEATGRPWTDPFCDVFQNFHRARWNDVPAQVTGRDFKALKLARQSYGDKLSLDNWERACCHYFQSPPKPKHSIFHLCEHFPVYLQSPVDRFNFPMEAQRDGASTSSSTQRKTHNQRAAEDTLRAAFAAFADDESEQDFADGGSGPLITIGRGADTHPPSGAPGCDDPTDPAPQSAAPRGYGRRTYA